MFGRRQLLVSVALAWLVGCAEDEDRRAAERVLVHHFDALVRRSYESALTDYDDRFYEGVTRSEWRSALADVVNKLGAFQRYDVSAFGLAYRKLAGPGTYLRFQCKVTYSKHTAEETFYLYRKQGSSKFKILGHQIDSDGLLLK